MHDKGVATGLANRAHKVAHKFITLGFINANSVLDSYWHAHHIRHGFNAISDQLRLGHQARAEGAALHPLAGAAAVQVNFVVAPLLAQLGCLRQVSRFAAAQLQRQRVFFSVEAQVARHVAVNQRAGGHHFGVKQRVLGQQTMKIAAVPVGPIHHGRNRQLACETARELAQSAIIYIAAHA